MQNVVEFLKKEGNLRVISEKLDVELEIPHIAYIEVKRRPHQHSIYNPIYKEIRY